MKLKAQTHTSIFELSAYYYCNKIWKELESRKRSIIAWKLCIYILASYFMIHGVKKLIIKLCFHFVQCKQKNKWKSVVFSVILTAFLSRRFYSYVSQSEIALFPDGHIESRIGMKWGFFLGLPIDYSCKVLVQIFQWLLRKRLK